MVETVAKLNIELKEGQLLDCDMTGFTRFIRKLSYSDLVDVHNCIVEEVNRR